MSLKEHTGLSLVFGDVDEVIKDQQWNLSSLGMPPFESELATDICSRWMRSMLRVNSTRQPLFDESEAERCRKLALAPARRP